MAIIFKDAINVTGNSTFTSSVTVSATLTADTVVASNQLTAEGDVDFNNASVEGLSASDVNLAGGISGVKYYYAPGSSSGSFVQKAVTLSNGIVTNWAT